MLDCWIKNCLSVLLGVGLMLTPCFASTDVAILKMLKHQISDNYGSAQVKVTGAIEWLKETPGEKGNTVQILSDNGRGELQFSVTGAQGEYAEGKLAFSAWIPARIATKRIRPGELLKQEWFTTQNINVAIGAGREYRGILLPVESDISKLETVQTVMEGQFLTSSAIRNIPDIRRGDAVRIHLLNGGMLLSTSGIAQEPGYLNRQIRVLTTKTKKELLGQLQPDGVVEVKI